MFKTLPLSILMLVSINCINDNESPYLEITGDNVINLKANNRFSHRFKYEIHPSHYQTEEDINFYITKGSLPPGVEKESWVPIISGRPSATGSFKFKVSASDVIKYTTEYNSDIILREHVADERWFLINVTTEN